MAEVITSTGDIHKLTAYERETNINWDDDTNVARIDTWNAAMIRHLTKLAEENPDEVKMIMLKNHAPQFLVPKKWVTVRKPRQMNLTEEQKQAFAERMKTLRK